MGRFWRFFRYCLLALAVVNAVGFIAVSADKIAGRNGLLIDVSEPLGGDFINLYATAQMTLQGLAADVYLPDRFQQFEHGIIPADIGLRLWAYPPTSLLLFWPFGIPDFLTSLALWSLLGMAVLVLGARRFGFSWLDAAIIALSPGAMHCLYYGQTGNLVAGLMLVALSARRNGEAGSAIAAALLTIKPQVGFLLPVLWAIQRQWRLIVVTAVLAVAFAGLSVLVFGFPRWSEYVFDTLTLLSGLEREGTGMFMNMIPSTFMAGRVLGLDADTALMVHGVFAATIFAVLVWRLVVVTDADRRASMVLLATALITPYMHSYDLSLLAAGALLAGRSLVPDTSVRSILSAMLVVACWGLSNLVLRFNMAGFPVSPLIILALFVVVAFGAERERQPVHSGLETPVAPAE